MEMSRVAGEESEEDSALASDRPGFKSVFAGRRHLAH